MTDHLPDVKHLSAEQEKRAYDLSKQMAESYWGLLSAARLIVHLQDRIVELERELVPKVCCQDFDNCRQQCIPLVDELRRRAATPPGDVTPTARKSYVERIHDAEQTAVGDVWTKRRNPAHFVEVLGRSGYGSKTLVLRHWNGRVTNKWYSYLASDYDLTKRATSTTEGAPK